MGRYDVVTYVDSSLLQVFFWRDYPTSIQAPGIPRNSYVENNIGGRLEGIETLEHV